MTPTEWLAEAAALRVECNGPDSCVWIDPKTGRPSYRVKPADIDDLDLGPWDWMFSPEYPVYPLGTDRRRRVDRLIAGMADPRFADAVLLEYIGGRR